MSAERTWAWSIVKQVDGRLGCPQAETVTTVSKPHTNMTAFLFNLQVTMKSNLENSYLVYSVLFYGILGFTLFGWSL